MNLRKHVKAPKRYAPELDDAPHEERYMPTVRKPLFQPPVIEYNPHLPPAAFPTLDKPKPDISETHQNTELGRLPSHQSSSKHVEVDHFRPAHPSAPQDEIRGQRESRLYSSPVRHEEPTRTRHEASINLSDPTYPAYYRGMPSSGPLTSDLLEAIQHEMETSDEESRPSSRKAATPKAGSYFQLLDHILMHQQHKSSTARSRPSWNALSPVLRIEILHGFVDRDVSPEIASSHLGISPEEWQDTVRWDTQREQVSEREDTKIQGMQEEIHRLLLDGGPIIKVTTSMYNRIFDRHLGSTVRSDKWHFNVCTKKQLEAAHAFLVFRGLSRSLAGQWDELESGNKYASRSVRETASRKEMSKMVEQLDGVTIQPAMNQKTKDPKANALSTSSPVHERGRSPIRRRYITQSQETSPSLSQYTRNILAPGGLPVPQSQPSSPRNTPSSHRPLAMAPCAGGDTIMEDVSSLPLPKQTAEPLGPSSLFKGSNAIVPRQPTANEPKSSLPTEQDEDYSDGSTILVQPKRGYTGTARPTVKAAPHPPGNSSCNSNAKSIIQGTGEMAARADSSTGDLSEVMERLRRNSLKHTGKAKPKPEEPIENGVQSSSQKAPKGSASLKNVKKLSVSTSLLIAPKASEDGRRATPGNLRSRSTTIAAGTPDQGGQGSPITPVKSGSSTRSSRATQLPARYRDDLVETPTVTSRPRKSSQSKELAGTAKAAKAEVASRKGSKGNKAATQPEEEEEEEDAEPMKRLATSPPGSREPPPKKQAGWKKASVPTPSVSRSETAQSSRAESVVSMVNAKGKKGKANAATTGPKAGKAPRKRAPRVTI
ncbi:hypothetical protein MMC30_007705 [Trapelia coarctata]|nr:hypothetical protein [Trapelia coarctata]